MLKGEKKLLESKTPVPIWLTRFAMVAIATLCIGLRMPTVDAASQQEFSEANIGMLAIKDRVNDSLKLRMHIRSKIHEAFASLTSRAAALLNSDSPERIRSIAIAIHNYNDATGHLPAASITADGSAYPHSWRIAILPYIEGGGEIYNNYKFDEPWDSEHNANATKNMPDLFRHSDQPDDATNSSIYVLTGPATLFESGKTVRIEDVPRLASTLMVFEAKRDTHWAEPTDIAFDKTNPEMVGELMEQLLGYSKDAIIASKADASTVPLNVNKYDADMLRTMILAFDE